jgi:hypothetical protein
MKLVPSPKVDGQAPPNRQHRDVPGRLCRAVSSSWMYSIQNRLRNGADALPNPTSPSRSDSTSLRIRQPALVTSAGKTAPREGVLWLCRAQPPGEIRRAPQGPRIPPRSGADRDFSALRLNRLGYCDGEHSVRHGRVDWSSSRSAGRQVSGQTEVVFEVTEAPGAAA